MIWRCARSMERVADGGTVLLSQRRWSATRPTSSNYRTWVSTKRPQAKWCDIYMLISTQITIWRIFCFGVKVSHSLCLYRTSTLWHQMWRLAEGRLRNLPHLLQVQSRSIQVQWPCRHMFTSRRYLSSRILLLYRRTTFRWRTTLRHLFQNRVRNRSIHRPYPLRVQ